MKKVIALAALALLSIAAGGQERKARPFSMGVTPFPYDMTPEAVEATQLWILDNTDIVAIKLDEGVPWQEALENKNSYDPKFEESLAMKARFPKEKRVFLSMTPLNKDKNGMAGYRGSEENMPNPDPWNKKDLDDPLVAKAYLNFCREMIRRYHPDYLAYGIEVNNLIKAPAKWKKFVPFAKDLYTALKKDNPQMPVILTLAADATALKFCFEEGVKLNAKFIIWMLPRDCDALYARIPPPINEILKLFKDTGLLDGDGKPRKSYELWSQWLKYQRVK
ncbi:MAG: hypothetical protein HY293_08065 [Planctomycetes bacterium]|nr:hypothetical protein [Planctomycetota bacterium]